jgi:hypothetical protein
LYLDPTKGFPKAVPAGAILDIGGTAGPTFTVDGRELMFADGTSTGPGGLSRLSLQRIYDISGTTTDPTATVAMSTGKHLILRDDNTSKVYFKVDADTGAITISGDLYVQGTTTTVNSSIIDADHYEITPSSGTNVALRINPDSGVAMTSDLINVSAVHDGLSVFKVAYDGTTIISTLRVTNNITLDGLLNGVDVVALRNDVNQHTSVSANKHQAKEINVLPGTFTDIPLPAGTTIRQVQTVLEFLDASINSIGTQVNDLHIDIDALQSLVDQNHGEFVTKTDNLQNQIDVINAEQNVEPKGFTFIAETPQIEWVVTHNKNSKNFIFVLFDGSGFQFQPDTARIVDDNTFVLGFGSPQTGRANMIFYNY